MDLSGIDRTALIDMASEDDLLLYDPSPRGNYDADRQEVGKEGTQREHLDKSCADNENAPVRDLPRKREKFNLRKSLAWDKAFFTSEGVLDTEELAIVNSTFRKVEPHVLPAIQEDMRKSSESSTTIDNENLTVESLEMELFGNIRASIQKSYDKGDRIPSIEQPCSTNGPRKVELQGSKMSGIPSHVGRKPPLVLKRDGVHNLRQNETPIEPPPSQDVASRKGNPTKIHKMVPSAATGPVKRSSIPQLTQGKKNTPKDSGSNYLRGTLNFAPKEQPSVTRKTTQGSSSSAISTGGRSAVSSTSYTRPGRMSDQTRIIPLNPPRKKVDSKKSAKNPFESSLVSESKSIPANAKIQKAFIKFSAVSPSSSFESIESACSSVSTATIGMNSSSDNTTYQSNGQKSVHCRSSDERNEYSAAPLALYRSHTPGVKSVKSGQPASVNRSSEIKLSKPSGLRMPRPKIGYFVAGKSMTGNLSASHVESQCATPRTTSRSQLESALQSATSSPVASPSTATVSASTKALDDQNQGRTYTLEKGGTCPP